MNKKIDKIINMVWLLAVALVVVVLFRTSENFGLKCMVDIVEQREYYVEFLWPAIFNKVCKSALGVIVVALVIYIQSMMDFDLDHKSRTFAYIRNIAYITVSLTLVGFVLFTTLYMKGYSYWMILFGVVILLSICLTIKNVVTCKSMERVNADESSDVEAEDAVDDMEKTDSKEDSDESRLDDIWVPVLKRFNFMLVAVGICCFFFCVNIKGNIDIAKASHYELNKEIIELGFEHEIGMEDNRALVKVQFVNLYTDTGRQYSLEILEDEYENFINGSGTWSNLWQFGRDSIDIELDSEYDITNDFVNLLYPTNVPDVVAEYYLGTDREYKKETGNNDYKSAVGDMFMDAAAYTFMVENNLNAKGLTMRQSNDSSADERANDAKFWEVYTSATKEDIYIACDEVYRGIITPELCVDMMDIEVNNVGAGDIKDASIQIADENIVISDYDFYELERIDGRDYKGDHISPIDGVLVENQTYLIRVILELPVYATVDEDTLDVNVEGLDEEKVLCGVEKKATHVKVTVDIKFRAK